eukprot:m.184895 g.184895  ORF g.184895 m.184895 type:complete len:207 (+) comp14722_c2_seq3:904-1524(+)
MACSSNSSRATTSVLPIDIPSNQCDCAVLRSTTTPSTTTTTAASTTTATTTTTTAATTAVTAATAAATAATAAAVAKDSKEADVPAATAGKAKPAFTLKAPSLKTASLAGSARPRAKVYVLSGTDWVDVALGFLVVTASVSCTQCTVVTRDGSYVCDIVKPTEATTLPTSSLSVRVSATPSGGEPCIHLFRFASIAAASEFMKQLK